MQQTRTGIKATNTYQTMKTTIRVNCAAPFMRGDSVGWKGDLKTARLTSPRQENLGDYLPYIL